MVAMTYHGTPFAHGLSSGIIYSAQFFSLTLQFIEMNISIPLAINTRYTQGVS
jgi:hypothetical protein